MLLLICGIITNQNFGQGIHAYESAKDTNTLNHFFEKGHFHGHLRSYFSSTVNQKELSAQIKEREKQRQKVALAVNAVIRREIEEAKKILARESAFIARGGKFLTPWLEELK